MHLVTAAGHVPELEKSAVGQHGFMIGADAEGSGSSFLQEGAEGELATELLDAGAQRGQPTARGRNYLRQLDYMPPPAIGAPAPATAIDPRKSGVARLHAGRAAHRQRRRSGRDGDADQVLAGRGPLPS